MKTISTRIVKKTLRNLGFEQVKGPRTGHELWAHPSGVRCKPSLRRKDTPLSYLYATGAQLERHGICSRRAFLSLVESRLPG